MKVSIIIPVYEEARTVAELLDEVSKQPLPIDREFVIVESNSKDGSRAIVESFAKEKNAAVSGSVQLILEERPRGKGYAVREALKRATGDIILIQDADLEYEVKDYPTVLAPILEGKTSFVLGSRHLGTGWKIRSFERSFLKSQMLNLGGVIFHAFFNLVYGTRLTDPTTMYKVFKRDCLDHFTLTGNRFDLDFELVGKLIRSGFMPIEVPVSYHSRSFAEGKKVRIVKDGLLFVRIILKTRFFPLKS